MTVQKIDQYFFGLDVEGAWAKLSVWNEHLEWLSSQVG